MFFKVHSTNVIRIYSPHFFKNDTDFNFEDSFPLYKFFNFYFERSLPFYKLYIFSDIIINEFSLFNNNVKFGISKYFIKDKEYNLFYMNCKIEVILFNYSSKENFKRPLNNLDLKIQLDFYSYIWNNLNFSISFSVKELVQLHVYLFAKKKGVKLYSNLNLITIYQKLEEANAPEFNDKFLDENFPREKIFQMNKENLLNKIESCYENKAKTERLKKTIFKIILKESLIIFEIPESIINQKIDKISLKKFFNKEYKTQSLKWHPDKNLNDIFEASEKTKLLASTNELVNAVFEEESDVIDEVFTIIPN